MGQKRKKGKKSKEKNPYESLFKRVISSAIRGTDLLECGHTFWRRRHEVDIPSPVLRKCYKCSRGTPAEVGGRERREIARAEKAKRRKSLPSKD